MTESRLEAIFHWHLVEDDCLQSEIGLSCPKPQLWSFLASQAQKQTDRCRQEN